MCRDTYLSRIMGVGLEDHHGARTTTAWSLQWVNKPQLFASNVMHLEIAFLASRLNALPRVAVCY